MQVSDASNAPYISETRIRAGDTLAAVLQRLDIDSPPAAELPDPRRQRAQHLQAVPGRSVQAATNENGDLVWLRYIHTPATNPAGRWSRGCCIVAPDGANGYKAEGSHPGHRTTDPRRGRHHPLSLFGATDAAGIPDSVTMQMADILSPRSTSCATCARATSSAV